MKKLIALLILVGWLCQPLMAQKSGTGATMSMHTPVEISDTPHMICYRVTISYTCPTGNCKLSISRGGTTQNVSYSGAPNYTPKTKVANVCFVKQSSQYSSSINCRAGNKADGCVVVVEGGG